MAIDVAVVAVAFAAFAGLALSWLVLPGGTRQPAQRVAAAPHISVERAAA